MIAARVFAAAVLVAAPAAAQDARWEYLPADTESLDPLASLHRAEITTEQIFAALGWRPDSESWQMFLRHPGTDPSGPWTLAAVYSEERTETLEIESDGTIEPPGTVNLQFDLPDDYVPHLRAALVLELAAAGEPVEISLSGSSDAIGLLIDAQPVAAEEYNAALAVEADAHAEMLAVCDRLAAWDGDPERASDPVTWSALDPEAAMMACFAAMQADPETQRYRFQLGRALAKAGLSGAEIYISEAADAGYAAAASYLEAGGEN